MPRPLSISRLHHLAGIPQYTNVARNFRYTSSFLTLDGLSGYYFTITSCQLERFRNEYLDEAESMPVYIWNVATWRVLANSSEAYCLSSSES
jgi:hypothetical protein